jgi:tryptophan-rich sensory protein
MSEVAIRPRPALVGLIAFGLVALAVAAIGGLSASSAASDYAALNRPAWAPSPAVFGPVWAVLYTTIAVAGWLVWRRSGFAGARAALTVYGVQLVLNALWTPLFFGADLFGLAFAEITALAVAIVATIVLFARHSRPAAALLVPYLAWVGFAATLNFAIWQLNP